MSKSITLARLAGALAISPLCAIAQEASKSTVSLGELSVLQVLTASKSLESSSEAPGIISTYTAEQIRAFGASNLLELLERLPGAFALTGTVFPSGVVTVRGIEMAEVSNRVLVLINGRPVRESTHGAMNMAMFTAFPLETIERVEMVRGPGSVLYGTNAYTGVINIITRDVADIRTGTTAAYGSFGAASLTGRGGLSRGGLSVVSGFKYATENDALRSGESVNLGQDLLGGTLVARFKRLTLNSFAGRSALSRHGTSDKMNTRHMTTDLGYEQPVTAWWDASVNATYNYTRNQFVADEKAKDYLVEATNHLSLGERVNLIAGGSAYHLSGSGKRLNRQHLPDYSELRWSGYTQLNVHATQWLKLVAGGQLNKVEGHALDLVPRVGAIFNAASGVGAKLLYGSAFRSPFAVERSINVPNIIRGNPELTPEKIATLDAQAFYNAAHVQVAATYFRSTLRDLILLVPQTTGGRMFQNLGHTEMQGLEVESTVKPTERLSLTGSLVYQITEDGSGNRIQSLVPSTLMKAGAWYTTSALTLGVFDSYFNAPRYTFRQGMSVGAAHYLTANANVNLTHLFGLTGFPELELNVFGTNLLGHRIESPVGNDRGASYVRTNGRAFNAGLRVSR